VQKDLAFSTDLPAKQRSRDVEVGSYVFIATALNFARSFRT